MHYVSAKNLTKSYGINPLFKQLSFEINEGDKIAMVARNGTGKSTLLKILNSKETPDEGQLWIHKDVKAVLFDQEPVFDETETVANNIFYHNHPMLNAVRDYERALDEHDDDLLSEALQTMDELQAWDFESKVNQILTRLNVHHFTQPVSQLSGGQRKRVALARTLIDIGFDDSHVLLMMDEPTNHLDVEMIEWLEYYLNQQHITLLMVTHDRYFLDAVADTIWELDTESLYAYKGDYANFLEKKAARIESDLATIDKAKNEFRKELEWMRKQPKARTTKAKSRIDRFYDVEKEAGRKIQDDQVQLQMKMNRIGGKVIELKKLYKSYGDNVILKGFDYTFNKGERIGVVGKNGAGKSTFLDIIQGLNPPDSGKVNIGDTVVFGYYNQQGLQFKHDMRVIEYVKTFAETFPLADGGSIGASKFLEMFLFSPDKQYTYLSALSGGEKRRLQLLSLLFRNPNVLILDEPTNDLDLPTLQVLENFLIHFKGTVLIVSHDRYFMDKLVDHLFVFDGDGEVRDFPGNYTLYRMEEDAKAKSGGKNEKSSGSSLNVQTPPPPLVVIASEVKATEKKKASFKEKKEFETIEQEMPALEKEKQTLSEKMNAGALPYTELEAAAKRIGDINKLMEEKELRWLQLSEMM